jgi:CheY-like chemotaxis protein
MAVRILVVEDNEKNRTLIRDVLEYHGYEVRTAADGASGIAAAKEFLPDVILMDIQMPVMDGLTAAKLIKADSATKKARLIALTSFAMKGDRERMLEAGFDDYIAKPINTRMLPELVRRYVSRRTAGGQAEVEP